MTFSIFTCTITWSYFYLHRTIIALYLIDFNQATKFLFYWLTRVFLNLRASLILFSWSILFFKLILSIVLLLFITPSISWLIFKVILWNCSLWKIYCIICRNMTNFFKMWWLVIIVFLALCFPFFILMIFLI